jgi:hypothetical protein
MRNAAPAGPPAFHEQASQIQHVVQSSGRTMGESSNGRFGNNESTGRGQGGSPVFSRPGGTEPSHNGNPGGAGAQGSEGSRGGWRSFGGNAGNNEARNNSHVPSGAGLGSSPGNSNVGRSDRPGSWGNSAGAGNVSKPQLQMAKPIVTPRSTSAPSGGYGAGGYGTYSRPPTTTYSRPSSPPQSYGNYSRDGMYGPYGGRGSAPSYNGGGRSSMPSYNGGGRSSAPSYSGGYSGGHSSAPSYSGGHSGGSSGGSHNSGGGHSSGGGGHNGGHR